MVSTIKLFGGLHERTSTPKRLMMQWGTCFRSSTEQPGIGLTQQPKTTPPED